MILWLAAQRMHALQGECTNRRATSAGFQHRTWGSDATCSHFHTSGNDCYFFSGLCKDSSEHACIHKDWRSQSLEAQSMQKGYAFLFVPCPAIGALYPKWFISIPNDTRTHLSTFLRSIVVLQISIRHAHGRKQSIQPSLARKCN